MYVHEVSMDNFVLIKANWSVKKALELIKAFEQITYLNPTHVIIHRTDPEYYYLYPIPEAEYILSKIAMEMTVHEAFDLHEWRAIARRSL